MDPASITTTTEAIDPVFMFLFAICLVLLVGITATMIGFVIRYHRSRNPEPTSRAEGSLWLEVVWTVLPTVLVLAMFYYGWAGYMSLRRVPNDAMEVTATARMWSWSFAYPNGRTSPTLYVPVGRPVKVNLVSADVIHGFFVPAFRVKRDVVPGMKNFVWFVAPRPGTFDLFCSQYCGTQHSSMITNVEALPSAEFAQWLKIEPEEEKGSGRAILQKRGCLGCHSLDGTRGVGPSFKGIWGREHTVVSGGKERTIKVDEAYISRSIREPKEDVVKGFPAIMPPFDLSKGEIREIVEFLKEER